MNILQEHWNKQEIVGIDGLFYNTGKVNALCIESELNPQAITTYGKVYDLQCDGETTIDKLIKRYTNDIWVEFEIAGKLVSDNGNCFLYGEGAMGNEGYITKLDSFGQVLWTFFSTTSNPFVDSKMLDKNLFGFLSTHEFILTVDDSCEDSPKFNIINPDFENDRIYR